MAQPAVFVSYSQSDRDIALGLVAYVERQGIGCWVAPRDVAPAADWAAEIVAAIAAARIMVLVFSAHANESQQVRREVERAVHRQVLVLPFRVADVLPASSLEYFLSSQHWLDAFPPPLEPHYARLCARLKTLLADPGAARSVPTAAAAAVARSAAAPDAATLQLLESELAPHVGPIAKHLVIRAALRAADLEALLLGLSREIESAAGRQQFVEACRLRLRGRG